MNVFGLFKKQEADHKADLEKAHRFVLFYENDGFKDMLDAMEDNVKDAVFRTKPTDHQLREELCNRVWAFQQVRQAIKTVIENGKVAEAELERLRKRS